MLLFPVHHVLGVSPESLIMAGLDTWWGMSCAGGCGCVACRLAAAGPVHHVCLCADD
jgi:hypothetical protein